jgi:hypothetical protein
MTTTARQHLQHIADQWAALRELLTPHTTGGWLPVMGIQHLERDDSRTVEAAREYAERTATAPGERPVPIDLGVLDTIQAITTELCDLADEIAGSIQRPAFTARIRGASPLDDVARSLALMATKDQHDPRRWHFNLTDRDGGHAAGWLADRLGDSGGPFRPVSPAQTQQIYRSARHCRRLLDVALGETTEQGQALGRACPCGGQLALHHDDQTFRVACRTCEIAWTGPELLQLLDTA